MLLRNLDEVRALIEEEVQMDIDARSMYQSPRLTDEGWAGYPALLLEAVRSHDPPWLEQQIKLRGWIKEQEQRVRNGVAHWARVPYGSPNAGRGRFQPLLPPRGLPRRDLGQERHGFGLPC